MTKGFAGFVKGMGTGIATGIVVGAVGSNALMNKKNFKKKAGKAVRAVGDFVDNMQYMMK